METLQRRIAEGLRYPTGSNVVASDIGTSSAAGIVREQVARGDRERRARSSSRLIARVALGGATVALGVAAIGRFLGWRPFVSIGLLVAVAAGVGIYIVIVRRLRETTDGIAARVDADAGLGGELRSAHWFAAQSSNAEWPAYHLERAAQRVGRIAWPAVYPRERQTRAWSVTALCAASALALGIHVPPRAPARTVDAVLADAAAKAGVTLPADIAAKLQEMLKDAGPLSEADAKALAALNDILKKINPGDDPAIAELLKRIQNATDVKNATKTGDLGKATDADAMPEDMKAALEDIASRLSDAKAGEKADSAMNASPNSDEGQFGKASSQSQTAKANAFNAAVQLVRETSLESAKGQQMMGGGGALNGDPSAGRGGNPGGRAGAPPPGLKADALRKELVEANQDATGQNVTKEDLRRKTDQGKSTLSFTHVTAAAVDKSRQAPPPPVPDARKALVQSYFIRHQ